MSSIVLPNSVIGIIGGGQIARMMALAAKKMGFKVGILDPNIDPSAKNIADFCVQASYHDAQELKDFAEKCTIVTYETLDADLSILRRIQGKTKIPQNLDLLQITKNRLLEKTFLDEKDMIIAPYKTIVKAVEINEAISTIGLPCILKSIHANKKHVIYSMKDAAEAMNLLREGSCILEAWIPAEYELCVTVCGNGKDSYHAFPAAEMIKRNNQLHEVVAPARIDKEALEEAKRIALEIAESLELIGVMNIEMFQTKEGGIYVHQLIARPGNAGFHTIESCNISQFEAHIRSICAWPVDELNQHTDAVLVNVLAEEYAESLNLIEGNPTWNFHYYGKEAIRKHRQMGHIIVLSQDVNQTLEEIYQTKIWD